MNSQCIVPVNEVRNRQEEKQFRKEALRAAGYIQHIIDDFVEQLFIADPDVNYHTIYTVALDDWNTTMNQFRNKLKPKFKHIKVDAFFFSKNYSPKNLNRISYL